MAIKAKQGKAMSTGLTLLTRARDRLSDATDQSFDDTTLMRYANDGAKEFTSTTDQNVVRLIFTHYS